jgi:TRAP-type C4-dicarboxylate transport system permease small subunit
MRRLDRLVDGIERMAAIFLAAITALMFVSVFLRYLFSWSIPDSYDFMRLMLGIVILWGLASVSYRGEHITVDLLWSFLPRAARRALDVFATSVTLIATGFFAWMMGSKVLSTRADNVLTYDLQFPVWIYYLVAWIGLAAAVLLLAARLIRLPTLPDEPEELHPTRTAD